MGDDGKRKFWTLKTLTVKKVIYNFLKAKTIIKIFK
jgi:hypothetical protein